jgi:cytochrome P450
MDSTGHTLYGSSVGSSDSIGKKSLISKGGDTEMTYTEAFDFAQEVLAVQMALPPFMHFLANSKRYKRACQKSKEEIMGYIERVLENRVKGRKYDFLRAIIAQTQDSEMICDQVLGTLLSGRDTTSANISWVFMALLQNPEVMRKLRREIEVAAGIGEAAKVPNQEQLRNMKYLQAVIKEGWNAPSMGLLWTLK